MTKAILDVSHQIYGFADLIRLTHNHTHARTVNNFATAIRVFCSHRDRAKTQIPNSVTGHRFNTVQFDERFQRVYTSPQH